jgi:hypothetical protein
VIPGIVAGPAVAQSLDISEAFSIATYTGNGATSRSIAGIDLSAGGLVWTHSLNVGQAAAMDYSDNGSSIFRGGGAAEITSPTTFGSSGFAMTDASINVNTRTYVSWMFRKIAKICDVVFYTGTGVAHSIPHALDAEPGLMIVFNRSTGFLRIYHRTVGPNSFLGAGNSNPSAGAEWGNTAPTSTHFTVGADTDTNANGVNFVALLLAESDLIKAFGYTGNNNAAGPIIDLDWPEGAQWLLFKRVTGTTTSWSCVDQGRTPGWVGSESRIDPFSTGSAAVTETIAAATDGFQIVTTSVMFNAASDYVCVAVRAP